MTSILPHFIDSPRLVPYVVPLDFKAE